MEKNMTFVGLDVHADSIQVAVKMPDGCFLEWRSGTDDAAVSRLIRKLEKVTDAGSIHACYEAGPTGYGLQRRLSAAGIKCDVIAPSKIPKRPGDRIKTDRRDARNLADLLAGGMLRVVRPPTPVEEAVRGLIRCRDDARINLTSARHRLSKFMLHCGLRWGKKSSWGKAHRRWLLSLEFDLELEKEAFESYLLSVAQIEDRLSNLDDRIAKIAETDPYREQVGWLCCFRGIDTLTAMVLLTELHGFERFRKARQLMGFLGMVPAEDSSGQTIKRGPITKTGNAFVRRILVQSAQHFRRPSRPSAVLKKRRSGQPTRVIAIADQAAQRLYRRYRHLTEAGKAPNKAVMAVARELSGFIWSVLQLEPDGITQ